MDYVTKIGQFHAGMMPPLLRLFQTFFPNGDRLLTDDYHDWLCQQNPFGAAKAVYVCGGETWAGFMALVPVLLRRRGETMNAYFVVNVLVDPSHQGRNLFGRMIAAACEFAKSENSALLGHPNAAALRFWQRKKMHFQQELRPVLALPKLSRISFTSRTVASVEMLHEAKDILECVAEQSSRWKVAATPEYLEWRFIKHPTNSYSVRLLERKGATVGVQITRRMKPGVHMLIDHFVEDAYKETAVAKLPPFTVCFMPDDFVTELEARVLRLPWKKRLPVFLTHFTEPVSPHETAELALSASDF